VDGPVEFTPVHSPRGGFGDGEGVHFFVPTVSRPGYISPLMVESRPTSSATTVVSGGRCV